MIQSLFFELIKVSVGAIGNLSRTPSEAEWGELYAMAKKQSLVGICFAGVHKLRISNASNTSNLSEQQYFTWMGMAAKVQQRNEVVNQRCIELQARLSADGISSSILKGQSVGALYPSSISLLRQSGDIDIYVDFERSVQGSMPKRSAESFVDSTIRTFIGQFIPIQKSRCIIVWM